MDCNSHDEVIKKSYDSKLMKRLLSYAKPYWHLLLLCIILMMIVTGLELSRPYILKITIDNYINGYKQPMYELDETFDNINIKSTEYNGKYYIRESSLTKDEISKLKNVNKKLIVKKGGSSYLVAFTTKDIDNGVLLSKDDFLKFRQEDLDGLKKISLIFLIVILFAFLFNYIQVYILNYTGQKIVYNIRNEVFSHLQKMSLSYYDKNPVGRLVTRVTNDTETLNEMYTGVLVYLFKDIFILIGIIIIMLKMNVKLALLCFSVMPFILIASIIFRSKIRNIYRIGRIQLAKINSTLNENITGMKTVHVFKKEDKMYDLFDNINKNYLDTSKREVKTFATFRPSIEIIRSLGMALIVYFGGKKVIGTEIPFGVLYAFIDYLQRFFEPILDLTEKYNILQSAMASSERIFMILDTKEDINNPTVITPIRDFKGKIEFKNVWFSYNNNDWVLKDVSFTINPGEIVAFVGATGAGKSSIMNLICRFYDIQKGEILIDGINIKNYDKYELRKKIGVVLQDVFLFTRTIKDNIRLNKKEITDEEIEKVAKYVNAHNFINKLPNKYNEPVMERGSTLSSGEKQLLAFARTLAFDPNILILDEATSSIDTETEILIQDALTKLIKGRTTIAVAHRLSTIQHSDKIIVLHNGRIKEVGNHQELLNAEGMYYDLYTLQYKENFSF